MSKFCVTYPLPNLTKQEKDRINKLMKEYGQIYNNVQKKMIKRWSYIQSTKKFRDLKTENKEEFNKYIQEYGFSRNGFHSYISGTYHTTRATTPQNSIKSSNKEWRKHIKSLGIDSVNLQYLADKCWKAWDTLIYRGGKTVKTNKKIDSVSFHNKKGYTVDKINHILSIMPLNITTPYRFQGNEYEIHADTCNISSIIIKREIIRGKFKYNLIIIYDGISYGKNHTLGEGKVAFDPSPMKIHLLSEGGESKTLSLFQTSIKDDEKKIVELQRHYDRQLRANNQIKYDKKGRPIKKKKVDTPIIYSKSSIKTYKQIKDLKRKIAAKRKIHQFVLCNELLSLGDTFIFEDNKYSSWAKRSKKTTTYVRKNKCARKKRFGKSILTGAPAQFKMLLYNKVESLGGKFLKVSQFNACTQFDFTNKEFTPHSLSERTITLSNGDKVHRDYLACLNIMYCKNAESMNSKKLKRVEKSASNFQVEKMSSWYDEHKNAIIIN